MGSLDPHITQVGSVHYDTPIEFSRDDVDSLYVDVEFEPQELIPSLDS